MKRLSVLLVALFLFLLCSSSFSPSLSEQSLRVGAILPLTGPAASLGKNIRQALELAHETLPPESRKRIELYVEDDGWDVKRAVAAFQKLVELDKVDAVFAVGSAVGNALAPRAEQKKMPFIALGASDLHIVAGRKFCFLHWVTPEEEARVLAAELSRRAYRNLALITAEQEGLLAINRAVMAELRRTGWDKKIVLDEHYLAGETEFRPFLAKVRAKKAEAIIVSLMPGAVASFAKQARNAGLKSDLVGVELFEDDNEVKAAEGALLNQWYVTQRSGLPEFEKAYSKKFSEHAGYGAVNGYDALILLSRAFEAHGLDTAAIAGYLASVKDFNGAAGVYSASGDQRFTIPGAAKLVTADGYKAIE